MNLYFTSEIRDCLDLFGTHMALRAQAKYATIAFNFQWKEGNLTVIVHVQ